MGSQCCSAEESPQCHTLHISLKSLKLPADPLCNQISISDQALTSRSINNLILFMDSSYHFGIDSNAFGFREHQLENQQDRIRHEIASFSSKELSPKCFQTKQQPSYNFKKKHQIQQGKTQPKLFQAHIYQPYCQTLRSVHQIVICFIPIFKPALSWKKQVKGAFRNTLTTIQQRKINLQQTPNINQNSPAVRLPLMHQSPGNIYFTKKQQNVPKILSFSSQQLSFLEKSSYKSQSFRKEKFSSEHSIMSQPSQQERSSGLPQPIYQQLRNQTSNSDHLESITMLQLSHKFGYEKLQFHEAILEVLLQPRKQGQIAINDFTFIVEHSGDVAKYARQWNKKIKNLKEVSKRKLSLQRRTLYGIKNHEEGTYLLQSWPYEHHSNSRYGSCASDSYISAKASSKISEYF